MKHCQFSFSLSEKSDRNMRRRQNLSTFMLLLASPANQKAHVDRPPLL
jgi:hypothetical protein